MAVDTRRKSTPQTGTVQRGPALPAAAADTTPPIEPGSAAERAHSDLIGAPRLAIIEMPPANQIGGFARPPRTGVDHAA
jgi:hypothetical protein